MRNLLILVLGAAVVWLLIERGQTTEELTVARKDVDQLRKRATDAEARLALTTGGRVTPGSPQPARTGSWLDAHVERGAKVLSQPPRVEK